MSYKTMSISSMRALFLEYSTFGGETNFTKSVGSAVFSLIVAVAGLQLSLISAGISESGFVLVSAISIVIFPIGIIYYTTKSAMRTTKAKFHSMKGCFKVMVLYLLIGGFSVLLLHIVGIMIMTDVGLFELSIPELLLGLALSLGFALVVSIENYSTLSDSYPSLQKVLARFKTESSEKLDGVNNVDNITMGEAGGRKCNLGVADDKTNFSQEKAIAQRAGGEYKGPWLINEDVGLIISSQSSSKVLCSYMGKLMQ